LIKILNFSLLFGIIFTVLASEQANYKIINSDKLVAEKKNDEYISHLIGNVHFFYNDIEFFSDEADIFDKRKFVKLIGNIKVFKDTLAIKAQFASYDKKNDYLFLRKKVEFVVLHFDSTQSRFYADKIEYNRNNGIITATDSVRAFDEKNNFKAKSELLVYNQKKGFGYLIKKPELYISGADSITIKAAKIEYYHDLGKVVGLFDVKTFNSDYQTSSNFLIYYHKDEKAVFSGEPKFFSKSGDAVSKQFNLFFKKNKLSKATLIDSSRIVFSSEKDGEKDSWITGNNVDIYFNQGKINKFIAKKNVVSYIISNKNNKEKYMENLTKSDNISVNFDKNNKIENIIVNKRVSGKYFFFNNSTKPLTNKEYDLKN